MMIYWAYFFGLLFLALVYPVRCPRLIYILSLAAMFVLAAMQGPTVSRDYDNYSNIYYGYANGYSDKGGAVSYEPGIAAVAAVGSIIGAGPNFLVGVFAFITLAFIGRVIWVASPAPLQSLLLYYSYFFFLHPVTQIRAGAAVAVLYWFFLNFKGGAAKRSFLGVSIGSLLHFSSVAFLPALMVRRAAQPIATSVLLVLGGVCFAALWTLVDPPLSALIWLADFGFSERLTIYVEGLVAGERSADVLNRMLPHIALTGLALSIISMRRRGVAPFGDWLVIYSLGCFSFGLLSFFPVLAYRVSDLFNVAMIIVVPSTGVAIARTTGSMTLTGPVSFIFFVYVVHIVKLVGPYTTAFDL